MGDGKPIPLFSWKDNMSTFSELDRHYDRHNKGICMDCGCTVFPWEYRCRWCRNKVAEDVAKEKEQKEESND